MGNESVNPKICVIIPSYNRVDLLRETLSDCLAQTYPDFSIIVVDSTDTPNGITRVVSEFQNSHRIVFREHAPRNVSIQRNIGIEIAVQTQSADFVTFIDSDDHVRPTYLEDLMFLQKKHNADLITTKLISAKETSFLEQIQRNFSKEELFDSSDALIAFFSNRISASVCGKLYKCSLLQTLRFKDDLVFYEDYDFVHRSLLQANTILLTSYQGYLYWKGDSNSSTRRRSLNNQQLLCMIRVCINMARTDYIDNNHRQGATITTGAMELLADNFLSVYPRLNINKNANPSMRHEYLNIIHSRTIKKAIRNYHPYNATSKRKKWIYLLSKHLYRTIARIHYKKHPDHYQIASLN